MYDENIQRLNESEVEEFLDWKNKVRHGLLKRVQRAGWKPSEDRMIRKLKWLLEHDTVESMSAAWESLDLDRRKRIWPNIIGSALVSCPEKAKMVLESTMKPLPPGYAVQDTLNFLAIWQHSLPSDEAVAHSEALADAVMRFLRLYRHRDDARLSLRQNTVFHMMTRLGVNKLEELYTCLVDHSVPLHPNTLLHFADRFAKDAKLKELALQITIAAVAAGGANLGSPQWLSLCTSILSPAPGEGDDSRIASAVDAFEELLQHGLTPNLINYTALVRALCLQGNLETAWDVVGIIQRHNIDPDVVLLSTLIEGAKRHLGAFEHIDRVTELAVKHKAFDAPFWNGIFWTIFGSAEATAARITPIPHIVPAFKPMLYFYSKIFHIEPLQHLIPVNLADLAESCRPEMSEQWQMTSRIFAGLDAVAAEVTEKLHPTGATLGIMYMAYVRSLSQASSVLSAYSFIRQVVRKGDPVVMRFIEDKKTFLYDVIIKTLSAHPGMLRAALDIVGDMLKANFDDKAQPTVHTGDVAGTGLRRKKGVHPIPSEYTWNILLRGFIMQKEDASSERILQMMKQHGVKPNLVTWNTMLSGYARLQNVSKAIMTLQRMEADGHETNEYTMRAFAKLARKDGALKKIEEAIGRNQKRRDEFPPRVDDVADLEDF
ncbi:Autophagy-related protein 8 [Verticillium dahliae VDG1]|nr:Autophagy-related protein 8 [Verticillium dahliae VDG1]